VTPSVPAGEVRLLGDSALVIGVHDASGARALAPALEAALAGAGAGAGVAGAEVVCGFGTVAVVLTETGARTEPDLGAARATVEAVLAAAPDLTAAALGPGRLVTIPCAFDGPDLAEVAALSRCSPEEVVTHLTARPLTVAVMGFSPGFAYLEGLPAALARVPRRDRPRPAVPAGSVALANGHAAVYPTASPGGWHLVGRTGFALFSATEPPYAALAPGDRVHFRPAAAGDPTAPPVSDPPAWSPPDGARRVLEVVAPGLRAVLQDGGRRGVAAVGVPIAGPADPTSFALANALVGNPPGAGALELTGGGTRLRCLGPCHVAIVGAAPEVRVDGAAVPGGQLLPLAPGQALEARALRRGCRTYLGVAGGLLGPLALGSSASDELCRLGPGPLEVGRQLWAGPWAPPLGDHLVAGAATELASDRPVELRVVPGPHPEWFVADALARLGDLVFCVTPESNRVGIRLRAERADAGLRVAGRGELDSQCVVTGAVQVPPDGDPVVLLPDHATLGGYPVLAVVATADHGRLGQCAPGARVRLVVVGADEAAEARGAQRRALAGAVIGPYPLAAG
jgi:KipI family sensor histidine kinase inhibitor